MNYCEISIRDMLKILGFDDSFKLQQRGRYASYLSFTKCNLDMDIGNIFGFRLELDGILKNSVIIELPDATVEEIYNYDKRFYAEQMTHMLRFIYEKSPDSQAFPEQLVLICFSILHEFGHWDYFVKLDCRMEDYIESDQKYREKIKSFERQEQFDAYRGIPSEEAADRFALRLMPYVLNDIVRNL